MNNIAFQPELRPALKDNHGPKDYRDFRERLESIDGILRDTGLEDEFVHRYLLKHAKDCSHRQLVFRSRGVYKAIRYSLLLALTGLSYRGLAERVADSDLMRWFVGAEAVDACRSYSKSSIERLEKLLDAEDVARLVHDVNRLAMDAERHRLVLPDGDPLDTEKIFTDTTCLVVDIHFPTDRGFDSADASRFLEGEEIFNAICSKDPAELRERAGSDALFAEMQTRRSSTEARIAIIKNAYLGQPMRGRCFESRDKRLAWCVLAHNLTKLVEIAMERRERLRQRKAA